MTIHTPGRRLMHAVPLKFVQKRVSGGGGRSTNAALSLTSMIDFLVVTVVFLLMTFDASGEKPVEKGVRLPSAIHAIDMLEAPIVAVTGSMILLDGKPAGNTRAITDASPKRMQRVEELFNQLKGKRDHWKQVNPQKEFPAVVVLQIDQDVEAVVVKSIFQTSALAGYPNVSFMVNKAAETK